jgi:hypothetical protein
MSSSDHGSLPPARPRTRRAPLETTRAERTSADPQDIESAAERVAPAAGEPPSEVGYGKPPKHSQFKPGQSGNPRGRPKAAKSLKTITRETLTQQVEVRTASGIRKMSRMEAVFHKTLELAMKGHPRALAQVIALYGAAVPDGAQGDAVDHGEDLSVADLAILEALKSSLLAAGGAS